METEKEKSTELISYISHEIKNSLNPVINLSGIMLKDKQRNLSNDDREYLEVIERNGRKILALVDYLSYINRFKAGKIIRSYISVSAKSVIENSLKSISVYRSQGSIKGNCFFENASEECRVDSESFKRIISCITEFFISVNNGGDLYYRIVCGQTDLALNISGISADEWPFQAENATRTFTTASLNETSLLWYFLAEELISLTDGRSDVKLFDDGRIVWYITLPVSEEGFSTCMRSVSVENSGIRTFTLMVIDDDPDTLIPVTAIAEHEFHGLCNVVHACSGSEAIDLLGRLRPDIILLDLTLPDINGLSLVRNIRNFFAREAVTVIAFTGHDLGFNREKLINSGFDDIIIKPFNIDEFVAKIKSWVK